MNRTFFLLLWLLVFPSLCSAETLDAVFDDPARAFTKMKRAKSPDALSFAAIKLDSTGKVVKKIYRDGTVTKDTQVAMGTFDEKKKEWVPGEEIPKGLWNEMFGDFSAKTVHVRIIQTDDRKGIAEILVKKIGDRPGRN